MTSKQRRNFPVPIGVIMLPLLLASALGIVIFSFNIYFVNYNKVYAANYDSSLKAQTKDARTDSARVNSGLAASVAESKYQHKNSRSASADLVSPKLRTDAAKTESKKTNNAGVVVPVKGIQSQRTEVKKTEPAVNAPSHAAKQKWLIQAGAFSVEHSAVQIKNRVASLGYNAEIIKTGTEKPLYKVMVSSGSSKATPGEALKKLKSIGIDGYIVIAGRP